jgi:hypothetical protein
VREQPEPTDGAQEQVRERLPEEDAMRSPAHDDPRSADDPHPSSSADS